jgi:Glycosyltransferase family 87
MKRPPLWLACAAIAAFWSALDTTRRWIEIFLIAPTHEDTRMIYVAAEAGLRFGWSRIYDQSVLRPLSASFPPYAQTINDVYTYLHPPLVAWLFAPLTIFSEPVAYALWSGLSAVALLFAWSIAAPFTGLARVTLLLAAIGLWPVLLAFYFGQPVILQMAAVAASWWLCARGKPVLAGIALAVAIFLKPQDIVLLPVTLLVSGRIRLIAAWAVSCIGLGMITAIVLGEAGVISWMHALQAGEGSSIHRVYTLIGLFGDGPLTYGLWLAQAALALTVARLRRNQLEIVFAVGLVASVAIAFHLHEADFSILVFAVWLALRTPLPLWHRLYLLIGIVPMQLLTFGSEETHSITDFIFRGPQFAWDAAWLLILTVGAFNAYRARAHAAAEPAHAGSSAAEVVAPSA